MDRSDTQPNPGAALSSATARTTPPTEAASSAVESRRALPLLVPAPANGLDPAAWAADRGEWIEAVLEDCGGILFRGFDLPTVAHFECFVRTISPDTLPYENRSTPRSRVAGNVYTSTEFPAHQSIPLHNELSYTAPWPLRIWFHCVTPAAISGETPIADSRRVLQAIGHEVSDEFRERGVLYVRNFRRGVGLSWQETFQTADRDRVEEFCRNAGIEYSWKGADDLQTREKRPALAVHPRTGERIWFNQAHLFHVSSLGEEVARLLVSEFGEAGLPRNAYYGDGSPIPRSSLSRIRDAYVREEIVFPWRRGDVLLLDNMLAAHGRRPYEGAREIVVAMTDSVTAPAV